MEFKILKINMKNNKTKNRKRTSNKTINMQLCVCAAPSPCREQLLLVSFLLFSFEEEEKKKKQKVLIKLAPAEGSRPPELLLQAGGFERKANQASGGAGGSEVRVQSSLARTCQTMRWLRSALARGVCSFMEGSSPSSASPSSSPILKSM